jgi:uncharacterized protein (TIGR03435 family)
MVRGIAILSIAAVAAAQTGTPDSTFDVASVRPATAPRPGAKVFAFGGASSSIQISGSRVTTRGSLTMLVAAAYGLERFQITLGPELVDRWANSEVYVVEARTPGEAIPTLERVRQMMRTLLSERFHLKFTRETTVTPVYNLVVAPEGPKLEHAAFGENAPTTRDQGSSGTQIRTRFVNFSMADFVGRIREQFDRPLLDKTGLTGSFDFSLEYRWQASGITAEAAQTLGMPDPEPGLPIIVSLRNQLGLRVVPAKEPMESLVIVHAERPESN